MADPHHRGLFSFFRSLLGQNTSSNTSGDTNDNDEAHTVEGSSVGNRSHDVEMFNGDVNGSAQPGPASFPAARNGSQNNRGGPPSLEDVDADSSGDELRLRGPSMPRSSTTSSAGSRSFAHPLLSSRRSHRRARVEDDEGDDERDRRHPSQRLRAADLFRRAPSMNQRERTTIHNGHSSSTSSDHLNPQTYNNINASNYRTHIHPLPSGSNIPSFAGARPSQSLNANSAPQNSTRSGSSNSRVNSSPPSGHGPFHSYDHHHHTHTPLQQRGGGPSIAFPIPPGAFPTLLRAMGRTMTDPPSPDIHAPAAGDGGGNANNIGTGPNTNQNMNQHPHLFPDMGATGFGDGPHGFPFPFPNFFEHPGFFSEERDDASRGRQIVDGLEEASEGLVRRLERVNKALNEDEGANCAVCWESLLDGAEAQWTTKEESTDPASQPVLSTEPSSTTPADANATGGEAEKKTKIATLPCAHIFHAECLVPWFSRPRQTTCPVCRFDVDPEGRIWSRRNRASMPPGMDFFGPMGDGPEGERDDGVLGDLMALAALTRLSSILRSRTRRDAPHGPTPSANGSQDNTAPANNPPTPENSNLMNQDEAQGPLHDLAQRLLRDMLGPAFGSEDDEGGPNQPRVRVVSSSDGGPGIQVYVEFSRDVTSEQPTANPRPDSNPAEGATQGTQSNDSTTPPSPHGQPPPFNQNSPNRHGHNHNRPHGPNISIGFDMIFGPPGPGVNPFTGLDPPGFLFGHPGRPPPPTNTAGNPSSTPAANTAPQQRQPEQPPRPYNRDHRRRAFNTDADGDVVMEFEQPFHIPSDGGPRRNVPAPSSNDNRQPNTSQSPPISHERRRQTYPPIPADGPFRSRRRSSGFNFPGENSGVRFFTGTATSLEDAFRQVNEHLGPDAHGPMPPPPPPPHRPSEQQPRRRSSEPTRTRSPTVILPPWMSQEALGQPTPGSAEPVQPTYAASSSAPPPPAPVQTAPSSTSSAPSSRQESRNFVSEPESFENTMNFDQFVRSWEQPGMPLPPLPRVSRSQPRPQPQPQPTQGAQASQGPRPHHPRGPNIPRPRPFSRPRPPPPEPQPERKWAPPSAPGLTLREQVEKKEREAGLRCWDMSCAIGPLDEEPLLDIQPEDMRQIHIKKPSGKGKAREDEPLVDVCNHTFHPSCLVSAGRVANSLWSDEGDKIEGDEVSVSCPVCRIEGVVSREVWQEGASSR
ncbi:hypothetical protein AAF712_003868 [Marasmius tenuissimus]|uniref:RING-type domain-containing protein n=1 Tax=Marasmius tenuissimus TaxID=585030 RepID=A0ABR3A5F1_9AGAR